MTILLFISGLVFLLLGAEALVRGASRIATAVGISPLVIGLAVVAIGTSSPELAVSLKSAMSHQAGIAVGNIIGSNIFNVLFILGLSALIIPLSVSQQLIRLDVPLMICISFIVLFFSLDHTISRMDGIVLVFGLIVYLSFLLYQSRKNNSDEYKTELKTKQNGYNKNHWVINTVLVISGLALLVAGSRWLVESSVTFAKYLGVDELIIGLTIISAGTSLPEVVTSAIAALRGERDIAVGNVVGSNIMNMMAVLGVTSIVAPSGIAVSDAVIRFDIPLMIVVAVACLPIFFTGCKISRWEGALLIGYYIAYTLYLYLASSKHAALTTFSTVMLYFVIPLTAVTIIIIAVQEWKQKSRSA
jgi:cation:H+ antiporter